jgi:hypothetical protein
LHQIRRSPKAFDFSLLLFARRGTRLFQQRSTFSLSLQRLRKKKKKSIERTMGMIFDAQFNGECLLV